VQNLADPGLASGLREPHGADDVDHRVELRVGNGVTDVDLRGQVENHLGPGVGEQCDEVGADDVGLGELEAVVPLRRDDVLAAAGAQIVDADNAVAVRQQAVYQR
jgi:hypothetical protein